MRVSSRSIGALSNRGRSIVTVPTAVSASAHVSPSGAVRAAPLLRMLDSAMWHSPEYFKLLVGSPVHDAFCVAQSVRVEAEARTLCGVPFAVGSDTKSPRSHAAGLGGALSASAWADTAGSTSITFGAAVTTAAGQCVASATRKFVRVSNGRPVEWSSAERGVLQELVAADVAASRKLSSGMLLPSIERLREPQAHQVPRSVFRVAVLPSMLGVGGHFDHAAAFEIACDAHLLSGGTDGGSANSYFSACINYISAARLGDVIEAVATADDGRLVSLRNAKTLETIAVVDFAGM